jgi:hypothetical protein
VLLPLLTGASFTVAELFARRRLRTTQRFGDLADFGDESLDESSRIVGASQSLPLTGLLRAKAYRLQSDLAYRPIFPVSAKISKMSITSPKPPPR